MNGLEGEVARHLLATARVPLGLEDRGARLVDDPHLSKHMHAILNDAIQLCVRELAEEAALPLVKLLADPYEAGALVVRHLPRDGVDLRIDEPGARAGVHL